MYTFIIIVLILAMVLNLFKNFMTKMVVEFLYLSKEGLGGVLF